MNYIMITPPTSCSRWTRKLFTNLIVCVRITKCTGCCLYEFAVPNCKDENITPLYIILGAGGMVWIWGFSTLYQIYLCVLTTVCFWLKMNMNYSLRPMAWVIIVKNMGYVFNCSKTKFNFLKRKNLKNASV